MSAHLNVNQFSLPGMENISHPGAKALSMGYKFRYQQDGTKQHTLQMRDTLDPGVRGGQLDWAGSTPNGSYKPGEISMVTTHSQMRGKGVASTLLNMGQHPDVHTGDDTLPQHSKARTNDGNAWVAKIGGWDPTVDTEETRPEHPYERRRRQDVSAGVIPKIPGQLQLPGTEE